jgi:hypothetical protein
MKGSPEKVSENLLMEVIFRDSPAVISRAILLSAL